MARDNEPLHVSVSVNARVHADGLQRSTPAPITIECEATGTYGDLGYCPMCGAVGDDLPIVQVDGFLLIDTHQRKDILAMIERGDFAP